MKDWNHILGHDIEETGAETIRLLESCISEGLLSTGTGQTGKNIFGRSVYREAGSDLSFVEGMAATGLRTSAFLKGAELTSNHNQLASLARQHLPTLIHYTANGVDPDGTPFFNPGSQLYDVASSGCFHLVASNLQEAIDFTIIAHKIAERALIPGILAMDASIAMEKNVAQIPSAEILRRFLGDPDTHILSPTPAQEIIFGKDRRLIPQWFSLDTPVMNGIRKDPWALDLEGVAQNRFFNHHLPDIIMEVMTEYFNLTGRLLTPINQYKTERADYLILTQGSTFEQLKPIIDQLHNKERIRIGCIHISLQRPFPGNTFVKGLKGVKAITVLEGGHSREQGEAPLYQEIKAGIQELGKQAPQMFSALHGSALSDEMLTGVVNNMVQKNEQKKRLYVGVDFTRAASSIPQHEILLQSIRRAYPNITEETIGAGNSTPLKKDSPAFRLPYAVQRYRDEGPTFTRLSRFFHHTACFYQTGLTAELVADPYQALPVAPAATASFADVTKERSALPLFEAQNCTGCGACFTYCPHNAIPPITIGIASLIRSAMDIAARQGTPVSGLTPMVRNLANISGQVIQEKNNEITQLGDFLFEAFDRLAVQMGLSGERLDKTREEVHILGKCLQTFPLAATKTFFKQPETIEQGTGELFSLAIDPHSCTGCGLCADVCGEEALVMQPYSLEQEKQLEENLRLWEQLPDTPSETIRRMLHQKDYNPFSATLLSRNFYFSTIGEPDSDEGAPARTTIHLLTAVAESVIQPRLAEQTARVKKLIDELSANIHDHLSDAIPHEDFNLDIADMKESKLPLDAIIRNLQSEGQPKMVDTPTLQRKVELLNNLKELHWALREGPTGTGRSRYGLSLYASEALSWGENYPYNIFTAPVFVHWQGAASKRLIGIMMGLRRHLIDNIRLVRRAELELKNKYRPEVHDLEIGSLGWGDLKEEEKQWLAPLVLVADHRIWSTIQANGLVELLMQDLPFKVIILDNAMDHSNVSISRSNMALFAAMSLRHAQIMRGSLGNDRAAFDALRDGLHSMKPALFHLLVPEQDGHVDQKANWIDLPERALQTRAFPAFRFDPDRSSGFLASDITIDANPSPDEDWVTQRWIYQEEEKEKEIKYRLTYADWLFTQKEWQPSFRVVEPEETTIPVAEYLALSLQDRSGKIPAIGKVDEDLKFTQYVADPQVIAATEEVRHQWDHLREIAGALTPFPEKLRQQVEKELSEKYEQSMAELRADYEEKMQNQEREWMEQVRQKLSNKLLALSKKGIPH